MQCVGNKILRALVAQNELYESTGRRRRTKMRYFIRCSNQPECERKGPLPIPMYAEFLHSAQYFRWTFILGFRFPICVYVVMVWVSLCILYFLICFDVVYAFQMAIFPTLNSILKDGYELRRKIYFIMVFRQTLYQLDLFRITREVN